MGSPAITFSRLPTVSMSKTTIGMRFSLHRAVAVRSITLSPRLYTSSYVISLNFVAVGSFSGSAVYMLLINYKWPRRSRGKELKHTVFCPIKKNKIFIVFSCVI